jgi:chitin disaccharide deacetylase
VPLLINADDFGLTPGVNRSVAELHQAGALTSATLMATAAYFEDAVEVARANPGLEVGCHVLLVDATPALPAAQVPSLCPDGRQFRVSLVELVRDLYLGRVRAEEMEAEVTAQIRKVQAAGVRISHIDTHKHTHVFPRILRPVLRAARACGIAAIRNPFEPAWARRVTPASSLPRNAAVAAMAWHKPAFTQLVGEAGLATTSGTIGVLATGTFEVSTTIERLLTALPQDGAAWELVCHPGYPDAALDQVRTRLRASRGKEHAALAALIPQSGIGLGSWRGLARTGSTTA